MVRAPAYIPGTNDYSEAGMPAGENVIMQAVKNFPKFVPELSEMKQEHANLIRWQQDPSEVIERQIQYLRGYKWDMRKQEWVQARKPLLKDDGIHELLTLINPFANQVTIMGQLGEEEVRKLKFRVRTVLRKWIALSEKSHEIAKRDRDIVLESCFQTIMAAVNRSAGGGDRSYSEAVTKFVESARPEYFAKPQQKVSL